jgi:hypothetical protein
MSNRKSVVLAFISTKQAHDVAIANLVADMKGTTYIKYRAEAAAIIGAKYSVEPHVSQLNKWMTFEKDTAAEQALSALMKHHPKRPTSKRTTSKPVTVPKATLNSIQSTIIEAELTKAQFDLLISKLRETIQFV